MDHTLCGAAQSGGSWRAPTGNLGPGAGGAAGTPCHPNIQLRPSVRTHKSPSKSDTWPQGQSDGVPASLSALTGRNRECGHVRVQAGAQVRQPEVSAGDAPGQCDPAGTGHHSAQSPLQRGLLSVQLEYQALSSRGLPHSQFFSRNSFYALTSTASRTICP